MCATIGCVASAGWQSLRHNHDEIHLHVADIGRKLGADLGRFPPETLLPG
jgi:hypothetical protein